MRIEHLKVESFRGIEVADLSLGPGLNLLYGPNDLGKSTIASAIGAALLAQPGTKAAEAYQPWHHDRPPHVVLVLRDADGRYWKIDKTFGSGSSASAKLYGSNDGIHFDLEASGRQVEGKVRALLRWGIPEPGGRRGPVGLPSSFLARVLLAEQTEVAAILSKSLDDDPDESGRLRLTEALQTLAQDPRLKQALNDAQAEYGRYYSPTGRRRRGRTSPFSEISESLTRLKHDETELEAKVESSRMAAEEVGRLRAEVRRAKDAVVEAQDALAVAKERSDAAQTRKGVEAALAKVRADLVTVDEAEQRARSKAHDAARKSEEEAAVERAVQELVDDLTKARSAHGDAKEALERAQSGEAEQARQLALAKMDAEAAALEAGLKEHGHHRASLQECIRRARALTQASERRSVLEADLARARDQLSRAKPKLEQADAELSLARGLRTYLHWKQAEAGATRARARAEQLASLRTKAAEARHRAAALRTEIEAAPALPSADDIDGLRALHQDLRVAEASLGGGLSLEVRPRRPLRLTSTVDGSSERTDPALAVPLQLEGDRRIELSIDELVDIEVTAGTAEARARLKELHDRWANEARPVVDRLGLPDLDALQRLRTARDAKEAEAAEHEAIAKRLDADIAREEEGAEDPAALEARALERARELDPIDRPRVEAAYAALGSDPDREVERRQREAEERLRQARDVAAEAERTVDRVRQELAGLGAEATRLHVGLDEARARLADLLGEPIPEDLSGLEALGQRLQASGDRSAQALEELQERRLRLARGATEELQALEHAQRDAADRVRALEASLQEARVRLDAARAARIEAETQREMLGQAAAAYDRPAIEAQCKEREEALSILPPLEPPFSEGEVELAQRRLVEAQGAFHDAERRLSEESGALKTAGGPAAEIELDDVRTAITRHEREERNLELEAKAWKLLVETLVETERTHGADLGQALSTAVADRFRDLTAGRYQSVAFTPSLTSEGVTIPGISNTAQVLSALSLGTLEQLATLLRVAIAEHLESVILLDDHLVQADPSRLDWFRTLLRRASHKAQIVILACRATDYVAQDELPVEGPVRNLAAGSTKVTDLSHVITRWCPEDGAAASAGARMNVPTATVVSDDRR